MEGEGFGEENEGEDNTDRLAESGDSHGKEGSELSDQAQDNLNIYFIDLNLDYEGNG